MSLLQLFLISLLVVCSSCSVNEKKDLKTHDSEVVKAEVLLRLPLSKAWKIVTEEKHLMKWWNKGVRLEPKTNGDFYEPWEDGRGNSQLATGKVIAFEKEKFIKFTWKEKSWKDNQQTICQIDFTYKEGGTLVNITHSNWDVFPPKKSKEVVKGFSGGWKVYLKKLESYSKKIL